MADLDHLEGCSPRPDSYPVQHRDGLAHVDRCVTCGAQRVEWLVEPSPELPEGFEPIRVPNTTYGTRIR